MVYVKYNENRLPLFGVRSQDWIPQSTNKTFANPSSCNEVNPEDKNYNRKINFALRSKYGPPMPH